MRLVRSRPSPKQKRWVRSPAPFVGIRRWGRFGDGEATVPFLDLLIREQRGGGEGAQAHEYQREPVVIRSGDVVLDAGAHLGTFTRTALRKGARIVVAVEPEPTNAACFGRTFESEIQQGRVILVEAALWDSPGTLTLNWSDEDSETGSVLPEGMGARSAQVRATTIDETLGALNLDRLDFVKMDIEGAERHALRGARQTMARFGPRMVLCTYHMWDDFVVLPKIAVEARPSYHILEGPRQVYFY